MKFFIYVFILISILSCSSTSKSVDIVLEEKTLYGRKFKLVSIYPQMNITIEFNEDNKLSGFSAVNRYSSLYNIDGDIFNVYSLITTLMSGDREKMKAEYEYLKLLKEATSYKIEGNRLTIYTLLSNHNLVFEEI